MTMALLLKAAGFFVAYCPRSFFPVIIWTVTKILRMFARKDLVRLRNNIELIYHLPAKTHFHEMFARQVLRHQVAAVLETIRVVKRPHQLRLLGFASLKAEIAKAEAKGTGVIIVTAHLGSWELVAQACAAASGYSMKVLAKRSKSAALTTYLDQLRQAMGVEVLWTDRKGLVRAMLSSLKSRCLLGFVMDQKPVGRIGPTVNFLGRPTEFVAGPAAMALRTKAPILGVYCVREAPFVYRIITDPIGANILEPPNRSTDSLDGDQAQVITQMMADSIARIITLYPEQWSWSYKRWRTNDANTGNRSSE